MRAGLRPARKNRFFPAANGGVSNRKGIVMKASGDFLALILFFATYALTGDMVAATAVAVVIGLAQAGYTWYRHKKLSIMQWVGLIVIVVFGGATILLKDAVFIMLKTTVICWIVALIVVVCQLLGKNGIKALMGKELQLPEAVWTRLSYAWAVFFFVMGAVNLAVAYPFTPEREAFWVNFKFWGYLPMTLAFSIAQGVYIVRHLPKQHQQQDDA